MCVLLGSVAHSSFSVSLLVFLLSEFLFGFRCLRWYGCGAIQFRIHVWLKYHEFVKNIHIRPATIKSIILIILMGDEILSTLHVLEKFSVQKKEKEKKNSEKTKGVNA